MESLSKKGMFVLLKDAIKFFIEDRLVFSIESCGKAFSVFVSKINEIGQGKFFLMNDFLGVKVVLMVCITNMGWEIEWQDVEIMLSDERVRKIFSI